MSARLRTVLVLLWFSALMSSSVSGETNEGEMEAQETQVSKETALVPDRDIAYASEETPEWKVRWDEARESSRQGCYEEALKEYLTLLQKKPNLDEARWEYTSILLHLTYWKRAEKQLDILQAGGKENPEYLFAQAEIALHTDKKALAVKLYSRLYVQFTSGERGLAALDGLTQALIAQGNHAIAQPLIEQLLLRRPDGTAFKRRAALLFTEVGEFEKARGLFERILPQYRDDRWVLKAYAKAVEGLGDKETAAAIRRECFALDRSDYDINLALAAYYRKQGNGEMELRHLEQVVDITNIDLSIFSRIAELNIDLGRTDKALQVSSSILAVYPDNSTFLKLRERTLTALAVELLTLVENSDAQFLWDDLRKITADREEVFRIMAGMLRDQRKVGVLTDVLSAMAAELPATDPLRKELDTLLERKKTAKKAAGKEKVQRVEREDHAQENNQ